MGRGKRPIFETGRWQFAEADGYTTFKNTSMATWQDLKIEVMDPKEMTPCLEVFSSVHDELENRKKKVENDIDEEKVKFDKAF